MSKKTARFESALEAKQYLEEVRVTSEGNIFKIKSGTLGLHRLGALDYLVKYHRYRVVWLHYHAS